jgi:hypothetical protein
MYTSILQQFGGLVSLSDASCPFVPVSLGPNVPKLFSSLLPFQEPLTKIKSNYIKVCAHLSFQFLYYISLITVTCGQCIAFVSQSLKAEYDNESSLRCTWHSFSAAVLVASRSLTRCCHSSIICCFCSTTACFIRTT